MDHSPDYPGPHNPDAVVTEVGHSTLLSKPPPSRCRCLAQSKSCRNCACGKAGIGCNESCGCGFSCGNRISRANLDDFFGRNADGKPHKLHRCFVTQLLKMPDATFEQLTRDNLFHSLYHELLPELSEFNDEIKKWQERWDELSSTAPDTTSNSAMLADQKIESQRALLRMGLIQDGMYEYFFSFCRGGGGGDWDMGGFGARKWGHRDTGRSERPILSGVWVQTDCTWHCPTCRECNDWREWHC
ncbi:hypothetical protein F4825DRAFT_444005 [Nemania diffusa]|nr:hypothetical protein F4825DRAFT_444005 [Nemania diffusa]